MSAHDESWDDLLVEWALHQLPAADRQRVEAHMTTCLRCQTRLRELEEATAALALAAPSTLLPAGFTARLVARAEASLPVEPSQAAPPAPARPHWSPGWWRPSGLAPALAGLALAVALVSGWQSIQLRQQLEAERAQTARLAEVLAAQPVTVRELRGTGAPQAGGRLTIAPDGQAAVLTARDLPPLLAGHVYQVWLVRNGQRTSGGVFTVEDGAGWLLVQAPESLRVYQAIGITVEPAPGSPGPTSPQVMGGTLQ